MLIDWFTVIAQVVNFLILVWLLKRFLYGPIVSAIDAREKSIAASLAEAEAKKTEAQKERDDFQKKDAAFDQQRGALLSKATEDAKTERERLLAKARKDADTARSGWQDALRNEQDGLGDEVVRRTQQGVFDIARKTLAELATTGLETCMSDVFIARLRSMSGTEKDQLGAALKTATTPPLVRSAFALPLAQRAEIETAVSETFAVSSPQIHYETAPNLVSGIEMTANGQKIAWSISDFLGSLEKNVGDLLKEKTAPAMPKSEVQLITKAKPEPAPEAKLTPELVSR